MSNTTRWLAAAAVVALAVLLWAPAAEACCTPCANICTPKVDPDLVCCTGIPVPGDACGHTTCCEYLYGRKCYQAEADAEEMAFVAPLQPERTPAREAECAGAGLFAAPQQAEPGVVISRPAVR